MNLPSSDVMDLDDFGLPSFQFPTAIPIPHHGPTAVAHIEVDPDGYQLLLDEEGGLRFPEALARFINEAAAASSQRPNGDNNTTTTTTIDPSLSASASTSAAAASASSPHAVTNAVSSSSPSSPPPPNLSLSHEVMLAIAQQCLDDPVAAEYMEGAFAATIEGDNITPSEMMTPNEGPPQTPQGNVATTSALMRSSSAILHGSPTRTILAPYNPSPSPSPSSRQSSINIAAMNTHTSSTGATHPSVPTHLHRVVRVVESTPVM